MGLARRRRARRRRRVRHSAGVVANPGNGERAILAARVLLQGPGDPRRVLPGDLAQGIFAFLVSVATLKLSGEDMRAAPLGRIGQGAILVAFPCLFAPAFIDATQPELANYIPLIRHPAYDFGLMALALGVLAPVVRLLVNLPGRLAAPPPLAIAMALAGFIYILALACFAIAGTLLAREGELAWSRAELFWGGGHVLQFVYAVLMLTNWSILARLSLGEKAVDNRVFLHLRSPGRADRNSRASVLRELSNRSPTISDEAFRLLQFGARRAHADVRRLARRPRPGASPSRGMAVARSRLLRLGDVARAVCAWRRDGSDDLRLGYAHARALSRGHHGGQRLQRRDAAHLRASELGRLPAPARATRVLIGLYGGGQFVASIGMFVAGGYGAARKTPTGVGSLDAVAAAGMAVHGDRLDFHDSSAARPSS